MAEKDTSARTLEEYNDVFADIINVIAFGGEQCVAPEDLIDVESRNGYHSDAGELCSQDRDIVKRWKKHPVEFVLFGLENQEYPDPDMPFRGFSYDGFSYRRELDEDAETADDSKTNAAETGDMPTNASATSDGSDGSDGELEAVKANMQPAHEQDSSSPDSDKPVPKRTRIRYPVITFVLYLGTHRRWTVPRTIHTALDIDPRLKPFVSDYHLNVIEVAWLDDDTIEKFQSDFKLVARFLKNLRQSKELDLGENPPMPKHVCAVLDFIKARLKGVHTEEDLLHYPTKGVPTMDFLQEAYKKKYEEGMEKGREEGMEKGMEKGREEGMEKGVESVLKNASTLGFPMDILKKLTGYSEEKIQSILAAPVAAT